MYKECLVCLESKPLKDFNKNKSKPDGLQGYCRICDNERAKTYYQANRTRMIRQIHEAASLRSKHVKTWLCQYLVEHPCVDCNERDIIVLEFDHLSDKSLNISEMLRGYFSVAKIEAEIAKCEVVCANCHKRRTDKRAHNYRSKFLQDIPF